MTAEGVMVLGIPIPSSSPVFLSVVAVFWHSGSSRASSVFPS